MFCHQLAAEFAQYTKRAAHEMLNTIFHILFIYYERKENTFTEFRINLAGVPYLYY